MAIAQSTLTSHVMYDSSNHARFQYHIAKGPFPLAFFPRVMVRAIVRQCLVVLGGIDLQPHNLTLTHFQKYKQASLYSEAYLYFTT